VAAKKKQSSAKKAVDGAVELSKKEAAKAKDAAKKAAGKAKERAKKHAAKAEAHAKKDAAKAKADAKKAAAKAKASESVSETVSAPAVPVTGASTITTGDTVVALRARARELGIPGYSRMSKAQLQERIAARS
jgi:membrane protein involved in colicin uptake